VHAAAAVIPPLDWARPATPDADAEADGLAPADARGDPVACVAVACGACGAGPVSHGQLPSDPSAVALVLRGLSVAPLTGRGCPVSL